ncbi:MAG: YihY/virulence factor BrkB family protein, partial [Candidatus Omnitrophica bacterium]|nr:YihY/virulence factor BrkB family protein [Candidatus Omnitrophota bacterium]
GVTRQSAIYGSFAALPLFLFWLLISWLIVLFGAEVAFAVQNVDTYEFEEDCLKASPAVRKIACLTIARLCVKRFEEGQEPLADQEISFELDIPIRLTRQLLEQLSRLRVLSEVRFNGAKKVAYQPGTDPRRLTDREILHLLERDGEENIPMKIPQDLIDLKNRLHRETV